MRRDFPIPGCTVSRRRCHSASNKTQNIDCLQQSTYTRFSRPLSPVPPCPLSPPSPSLLPTVPRSRIPQLLRLALPAGDADHHVRQVPGEILPHGGPLPVLIPRPRLRRGCFPQAFCPVRNTFTIPDSPSPVPCPSRRRFHF